MSKRDSKDINKKRAQARSFYNKGDLANASKVYAQLCSMTTDPESYYMMGLILSDSGNPAHAIQYLNNAINLDPAYAEAWNLLGTILISQRNYPGAVKCLNKSLDIKPTNTQALNNLGNIYRELGKHQEAENFYNKSLSIDSNNSITLNNIANIYLSQCQYDKAELYYRRAIKLNGKYFDALYNLGATYQCNGDHKKAINLYKRAQNANPKEIRPQIAIANSYEKQGQHEKALKIILPLIESNVIAPDIADIYSKLCIKNKEYDKAISVVKKCLLLHPDNIHEQILHFNLGDLYDKLGEFDSAFEEYERANTMRPYRYDQAQSEASFNTIKQVFESSPQACISSENNTDIPIFIVGMPRSGTTLIEQILSSHTDVCGAGEMPYLAEIIEQPVSDDKSIRYPESINHLSTEDLALYAESYLEKLMMHGDGSKHISDKMPHNFMLAGLIRMIFPNCKIIHCLRNPLDVCLSIYFHNFNQNHPYSDNLASLGHYYNQYRELMDFWHDKYDDLIIDIAYEDLLTDAESNVRRLLDFLGLDWQEDCLRYYESKRTVSTPSYSQVNQPLYTTSMERWRNYSSHIDDLKNAIDKRYLKIPDE